MSTFPSPTNEENDDDAVRATIVGAIGCFIIRVFPPELVCDLVDRKQKIVNEILASVENHSCTNGATCTTFLIPDAVVFCRFNPHILIRAQQADTNDFEIMKREARRWRNFRMMQS